MIHPTPYCLTLVLVGLAGCVKVSETSMPAPGDPAAGDNVDLRQCLGKNSAEIKAIFGDPLGTDVIESEDDEASVDRASVVTSIHRYHASGEELLIHYDKQNKVSKITYGGEDFTVP